VHVDNARLGKPVVAVADGMVAAWPTTKRYARPGLRPSRVTRVTPITPMVVDTERTMVLGVIATKDSDLSDTRKHLVSYLPGAYH
jgi:hypothetical protein